MLIKKEDGRHIRTLLQILARRASGITGAVHYPVDLLVDNILAKAKSPGGRMNGSFEFSDTTPSPFEFVAGLHPPQFPNVGAHRYAILEL